jgi:hypothetical protein
MRQLKVWPHMTMVALVCALLGGGAAALWVKHQRSNEVKTLPSAARIERVDGQVGVSHNVAAASDAQQQQQEQGQWLQATTNMPVSVGDRIYARDDSRASVAFTGRNFARLNPRTSLDVMYLAPDRTQVALRDGSAIFDVGALAPGQLFEVATPFDAVDFDQPGLYQVGYNDNGSAYVSVLSGLARVVGLGGTGQVGKGEMLTLLGQTAADVVLSRLDPSYAGGLLNDYYGYRYPRLYDGRYSDYNAYLNDPNYYDPYNRFTSYRYVNDYIPGVEDLDAYGDWQDVGGYGECWHPRVDAGWTPYQDGYWTVEDPYGLTWVSNEPWGYAPYHYGRWASVNNQWFWVPETVNTQPVYSPALVAFLPLAQTNEVGWVPLGPGDPYAPTYYGPNWQPHYFGVGGAPVVQQLVNMRVPGAATVVPVQSFDNVINQRAVMRVDPQALAQVRPVLDPFAVNYLRQAALQAPNGRRPFDVPPGIARKFEETRVVASTAPSALPFMPNPAQALRVQTVPEGEKRQKLQFRDERAGATAQVNGDGRPALGQTQGRANAPLLDQQRSQQMAALASEAARGNRDARRQLQQLQREQREQQRVEAQQQRASAQAPQGTPQTVAPQAGNDRAAHMAERQQAQGERVALRQQQQAQRDAERQQALAAREQQRASMRQQLEARRQANAQASAVRAQQAAQREQQMRARAQQQQQVRQQPVRQAPPQAHVRVEQPRPQPQPQIRQQGPPQNAERRQGPPPQAARPQPSQGQGQGHGGGKGKGHP